MNSHSLPESKLQLHWLLMGDSGNLMRLWARLGTFFATFAMGSIIPMTWHQWYQASKSMWFIVLVKFQRMSMKSHNRTGFENRNFQKYRSFQSWSHTSCTGEVSHIDPIAQLAIWPGSNCIAGPSGHCQCQSNKCQHLQQSPSISQAFEQPEIDTKRRVTTCCHWQGKCCFSWWLTRELWTKLMYS